MTARRLASLLAAATATLLTVPLLVGAAPTATPRQNPSPDAFADALADRATAQGAMRHLAAFQRIADASDGNRAAGTPGHERSARYAGTLLAAAGYDVTYQRFPFSYREAVTERLTQLTPEQRDIPVRTLTYTPATPDGGIEAPLTDAGTACAPAPAPDAYAGHIVLVTRGDCTFAEKQANAAAGGALAAVVANNAEGPLRGTLGSPEADSIPVGGITRADGAALATALTDAGDAGGAPVTLRLELAELAEDRETVNVIAETPGGDPDHVVMAGAHLDSVADGPGINDNGSGSAGILETALRLAEADPEGRAPHRVRFALWSAEESGLLGSEHYVADLTRGQLSDIALYLNFDMIGSPNHGLFVQAEDTAIAADLTAFLGDEGHTAGSVPFDGRSDYAPFHEAGVRVGGVFTGAEGAKTAAEAELWGGTADTPYDPCYHQACDDLANISRDALAVTVRLIAHSVGGYAWQLPHSAP
ncbi:M28 family peptidase [Streptomyces avicenniae]|uniref:M28 family peptidase n=1 Tax=Streptomyces avicenniae TaxID=500153 RepID=UPI00069A39EA|nr:M28 family peptidase [Streptomyces avicenniae]